MINKREELHNGAVGFIFGFGKKLRKDQTEAEKVLWAQLRGRKLKGLKFRRQHPLGNYIADFYCHELKLVIELDGEIHDSVEAKLNDKIRTQYLIENGFQVLRFKNLEVLGEINTVLQKILNAKKY